MIATTVLCPITVIKTKMEYADNGYRSIIHAASNIYKKNGTRGFFRLIQIGIYNISMKFI